MTWGWPALIIAGLFMALLADALAAVWFLLSRRARTRRTIRRRLGLG